MFGRVFMKILSCKRDPNTRKGLEGINMVKLWKNRAWFLDEGAEVQGNIIIETL